MMKTTLYRYAIRILYIGISVVLKLYRKNRAIFLDNGNRTNQFVGERSANRIASWCICPLESQ